MHGFDTRRLDFWPRGPIIFGFVLFFFVPRVSPVWEEGFCICIIIMDRLPENGTIIGPEVSPFRKSPFQSNKAQNNNCPQVQGLLVPKTRSGQKLRLFDGTALSREHVVLFWAATSYTCAIRANHAVRLGWCNQTRRIQKMSVLILRRLLKYMANHLAAPRKNIYSLGPINQHG